MNVIGIIRVHPRGFAFVTPDDGSEEIFIPKRAMGEAVDRDRVEVAVSPSEKGSEGVVLRIVERFLSEVVGIILGKGAYVPLLGKEKKITVKGSKKKLQRGERVKLKIIDWGEGSKAPLVAEHLLSFGSIYNPAIDVAVAKQEFGIEEIFKQEAVEAAEKYGKMVKKKDLEGREDFTQDEVFTIDPTTARDFDDALSLTKNRKGFYHLHVHIADVSHYVRPGSVLDDEAYLRSNSTYFPGECVPMLPEALSNHLCSLVPGEIRLTVTVKMEFDKSGILVAYSIVKGFIKSQTRFTYEEAKEVLDGERKSPHLSALKRMVELCTKLKKLRKERGSVDLTLPETVLKLDKKGAPVGLEVIEYDITHQLVEEFMLKANEAVASHFTRHDQLTAFRIHEPPAAKDLADFYALARRLGFKLKAVPEEVDIQTLFEKAKETPFAGQLSTAFIRSMKLAIYSTANIGHYGLKLTNYCHFTSPIRRYSDLITHRLLFDPTWEIDLEIASKYISEKERNSFRAESRVLLLKKLRFLKEGEKYGGTITKVKPHGLTFDIQELAFEGFIHISAIGKEFFEYNAETDVITGTRSGKTYSVGQAITARLTSADLIYLDTSWAIV